MTDKAEKGFGYNPKKADPMKALSFEEPVGEEAAPEVEEVVEEVVVEEPAPVVEAPVVAPPAPQDPITKAEAEQAAVYDMIAEARANAAPAKDPLSIAEQQAANIDKMIVEARANAAKKQQVGGAYDEKAAILAERKKDVQNTIASLYTTGAWAGKPNYECTACPYATLDEDLIKQHVTKHI